MPKIYLAADHAGFDLKNALVSHLQTLGYEVEDLGASVLNPEDDYPNYVTPLAERVAAEPDTRGIVIGGSGQGEAMCANRVKGVRAIVFYGKMRVTAALEVEGGKSQDGYDIVRLGRRHNDANVLSLGARFISVEEADEAVRTFLETPFAADAVRHSRRLSKF